MSKAHCCIAVFCGLPASGKTTLCQQLKQATVEGYEINHLSFDESWRDGQGLRNGNAEEFQPEVWKESRLKAYEEMEKLLNRELPSYQRQLLLIDDNMHLRSMRRKCYQIARKCGAAFVLAYLPCSLEDALRRNAVREGAAKVPSEVIVHMAEALEPPDLNGPPWDRNYFKVHDNNSQAVLEEILQRWHGPVEPLPEAPETSPPDLAHSLDILCRQAISHTLASTEESRRAAKALELNQARRALLKRTRREGLASEGELEKCAMEFRELCDS